MELKRFKLILMVVMAFIWLYLLMQMFSDDLNKRPLLPRTRHQSDILQTRNITNQTLFPRTRNQSDIRISNKNTKFRMTQSNDNCSHYNMSKQNIKQLKGRWSSPIVVSKYKLIFFWSEKSACTYWKRLLQLIQGINKTALHNARSGLTTLKMFNDCNITAMMQSNQWVKAAFVREPRERILSSYLDKGQYKHVMNELCRINRQVSFYEFLEIIKRCKEGHWGQQVRAPKHFYKQMMIGKFSEISSFTERLLKRIGAWNETVVYWITSSKHIYQPHSTNAKSKLLTYYNNTKSQDLIFDLFSDDYNVFGFEKTYFK
ncbi:Hypothetical predicted protein [Mytilus galloprovincialis]|uniref:Carbohydrate sulfotransferase n=1 Tax=Mytilus galloprovincialis TaxID=29158 RepID=A0A8B6BRY5_MYTGA|nr:Hypothetical predicted protein [Mytilus galloprovincialis]